MNSPAVSPSLLRVETTRRHLAAVRAELARRAIDAIVVPRADEYLGEYIPEHNERLRWLTGFTGSAGAAVVTAERAALFVDGRYTVQVRRQASTEDFSFHSLMDEPPVEWLAQSLSAGARVLIDPRLCSLQWFESACRRLESRGIEVLSDTDNPVDRCWEDRPAEKIETALCLGEAHSGESSVSKRHRIGEAIAAAGADAALIFAPDSVSWLLNLRGRDVPRLPVLLGFAMLSADGRLDLAVNPRRLPEGFEAHVGSGVRVFDYGDAETLLSQWSGKRVMADPAGANAWTQLALRAGGAELVAGEDPVLLPKACKNSVELAGARAAHRRDAVAVIRFLAWLDGEVAAGRLHDEARLADQLAAFRAEGDEFHEPSFDTISAAAANGAMCHYNHLDNEAGLLEAGNLYLVDSGGQYTDGTTDITRTVAIGEPAAEMRELFTLVLKGHIALDRARFPAGTTGTHLDVLARQFLWNTGRDYDHGTGHGVGAFLSVHEGPQRIARAWNATALRPGMIVSNEPGYYRDGAFGIRCENLVVVQEVDGDFERSMLGFEAITLVPFDRRLIDVALLDEGERGWIDAYHARVAGEIAPLLPEEVQDWLEVATAPLPR
ncbi:MAG: aminopeptidase P family protein [Halieaceae bacterium]|jgi:Xaa-Pro aminopeptidase|nr:aminopeptidase P family protein [Halieaceae bacterium]